MPKIKVPTDLSNITDPNTFIRFGSIVINDITSLINGKMTPEDNLDTKLVTCAFTSANTEFGFNHDLNRIPSGYILYGSTVAMAIYDGSSDNTKTKIYLKSNAVGTARVLVF